MIQRTPGDVHKGQPMGTSACEFHQRPYNRYMEHVSHPSSEGRRRSRHAIVVFAMMACCSAVAAQTTTPGTAIDVEIYNPVDGTNRFCVAVNESFTARVLVHPGDTSTTCGLSCSAGAATIPGGSANIATGIIDLEFDPALLGFVAASNNPTSAAADGLIQDNSNEGRIGWALAGDWNTDADPTSGLKTPCDMGFLALSGWTPDNGWAFETTFQGQAPGITSIHIRRQSDPTPFALSFADICGTDAFTISNNGVDEVVDATVAVSPSCSSMIFFDGFEPSNTRAWSRESP